VKDPPSRRRSLDTFGRTEHRPVDLAQLSFLTENGAPPLQAESPTADAYGRAAGWQDRKSSSRSAARACAGIHPPAAGADDDDHVVRGDAASIRHQLPHEAVDDVDPASLASTFGVEFALPPSANGVVLDDAGHVVRGHLEIFAALSVGRKVSAATVRYDVGMLHAAAVVEHDQCRAVGNTAPKLLGHASRLGVETGRSKTAIARDLRVSRSLVARVAAVTALRAKYHDVGVTQSHFEAVLSLSEPEQRRFLQEAVERELSVRELEDLVATAHPERRRQRRGEETLAEIIDLAGLAELMGDGWKNERRVCIAVVRRLLRLINDRAPHLVARATWHARKDST